jgi:hypothetical protein
MRPPAAATSHRSRKLRRTPVPRAPRRVSGPRRPPRAALAGAGGAAVARPPLSLRLGRRAMRVGDARVLDRLVRGRAWIAIVAAALIGIVFMQVSMLKLNAGVSRAVTAADTLERQNSILRADISKLDSGERIQDAALNSGMVTPPAGDVRYLDGERADAARASASIKPPSPVAPVATTAAPATTPTQTAPATQQQAPAAQQPAATAQAAATQQQTPAAQQQQAPATQQQAPTVQQQAPATQQGGAAATSGTTGTTSVAGGATPGEG